ncbi:unnamed protein product [Amoebophrya sp. A25]|nr:unnamed protein product [Amoebophrya sp. A25]|eukprot:GSA25T00004062001.1
MKNEDNLQSVLNQHFHELVRWKKQLIEDDAATRESVATLRAGAGAAGGGSTSGSSLALANRNNLDAAGGSRPVAEIRGEDLLRSTFQSPELKALSLLDDILGKTENIKDSHRQNRLLTTSGPPGQSTSAPPFGNFSPAARGGTGTSKEAAGTNNNTNIMLGGGQRPWQRQQQPTGFAGKKANELESMLSEIESRIKQEPAVIPRSFLEDLEALIRQNAILKAESEKNALKMIEMQEEVTKLRADADQNQDTFNSMRALLAKTTNERNELAEQARHGLATRERDEYAKQIVKVERIARDYEKHIAELESMVKSKDRQLAMAETEKAKLKSLGRKQAEKFKDDVTRLVHDKKSLRAFLDKIQDHQNDQQLAAESGGAKNGDHGTIDAVMTSISMAKNKGGSKAFR